MKKIFPYIFIALIITNLFAPFSLGLNVNKNLVVVKNEAKADTTYNTCLSSGGEICPESVDIGFAGTYATIGITFDSSGPIGLPGVAGLKYKISANVNNVDYPFPADTDGYTIVTDKGAGGVSGYKKFTTNVIKPTSLTPNTTYTITYSIAMYVLETGGKLMMTDGHQKIVTTGGTDIYFSLTNQTASFKTNADDKVPTSTTVAPPIYAGPTDGMPACSLTGTLTLGFAEGHGTFMGCVAQSLYYVLFVPSSFLFGVAGMFFDAIFAYSVDSASYQNTFVVQGWGLVRDFCNIFFIFVLLYAALTIILDLGHHGEGKKIVINVIIIGLLINFSLFATQVIIDSSNILARLFYNSNVIQVKVTGSDGTQQNANTLNAAGVPTYTQGVNGEIPLSAAIVGKVNPQQLIIRSSDVGKADYSSIATGAVKDADVGNNLGTGTFILVTLLATGICIVGMLVFLSVGLIFISRVVGLWLAMIMAPFAFFSYTVPAMQDIDMVGWKKWWPDTLKMAFLAPIFMFFMYLIIGFLDTGLGIFPADKTTGLMGMKFVVATVVPFALIMILMMYAKKIATKFSGEIGQSVTKGIAAIGGAAIMGGVGVGAALGRGLISNPMKMMQSSQSTRDAALKNFSLLKPSTYGKAVSARMANVTIGKPKTTTITNPDGTTTTKTVDGSNKLRDKLLEYNKKGSEKSHATHILDEQADKIQKGSKFSELNADEQIKAKTNANKDQISKFLFNKDSTNLSTGQVAMLSNSMDGNGSVKIAELTRYAANLHKDMTKFKDKEDAITLEKKYNTPDKNITMQATSSVASGTYDLRKIKTDGLLAPIAGTLRLALKQGLGIGITKPQNDFFKDLKETLTESMKNIKVKIDTGSSDHGSTNDKHDDHHGGEHH